MGDSPRVLNIRKHGKPDDAVLVDRSTRWGNPFQIGRDGTRLEVITKHAEWIKTQPRILACLGDLEGKDLVCWCAPLPCHAETLKNMANKKCP